MLMTAVTDETDEETDELESTTDDDEAEGPQLEEITKFLRHLYRKPHDAQLIGRTLKPCHFR
jgi:hypothetical protein